MPQTEQVSVYGQGGNDSIVGGIQADYLDGGAGTDNLFGHSGDDTLLGQDGDDDLDGDQGHDFLIGGTGWDVLYGGKYSGSGNDTLNGGGSYYEDELYGGDGNDTYLHYNNDGGFDEITDASGSADHLVFNDATLSDLAALIVNGSDLVLWTQSDAADGYLDNGVYIHNYIYNNQHGMGEIEYLTIGNSTYSLWGLLGLA
ncbi:hypothetical protein [Azospirillum sp.]|uniref:calcium-binding protein n=1 Tax=Azospirillum sp. TaxID=34012 RepID=UPI002D64142C|nr:hypothetical protein [Azospirillum sp.]HYD66920.1 hypothetical protein [Azospirillum sp.]